MNAPKTLNALSDVTIRELSQALDRIDADDSVRAVVVTGSGKAFVAGADIAYMSTLTPEQARSFARDTTDLYRRIADSRKVFLAAVNGFALGAGASSPWPATCGWPRSTPGSACPR